MATSKGLSGPDAKAGHEKLQELLSKGAAGARAKAAATLPGNQYVTVSNWNGQASGGAISSTAIVAPINDTVILTVAAMLVEDTNQSGGGGGFFTVLDPGVGAVVGGAGNGSGNFTAFLLGMVLVNNQVQQFIFTQNF